MLSLIEKHVLLNWKYILFFICRGKQNPTVSFHFYNVTSLACIHLGILTSFISSFLLDYGREQICVWSLPILIFLKVLTLPIRKRASLQRCVLLCLCVLLFCALWYIMTNRNQMYKTCLYLCCLNVAITSCKLQLWLMRFLW